VTTTAAVAGTASSGATRNQTLDGLRGLASVSVMFYHLYGNLRAEFGAGIPVWLRAVFENGFLGVQVFFVLSGYAIAAAVGDRVLSGRFVGRFALRRSVRLDPPYWASMVVDAGVVVVGAQLVSGRTLDLPSWWEYAIHVLYLQDLIGIPPISDVYWTLCIEVQFYLFFVVLLMLLQRSTGATLVSDVLRRPVVRLVLGCLLGASLAIHSGWLTVPKGTFTPHWFLFSVGAVVFWCHRGWLEARWLGWCLLVVALALLVEPTPQIAAGLVTGLVLAPKRGLSGLTSALQSRPALFLASISYSLYLVHASVGWSAISLAKRVLSLEADATLGAWASFCFGGLVSVTTAWILWRLVESPSQRFSRRVGQ
jgi:peptidoglycan/LPS O-acetylase OafA/YrhL